ncbi:hypothetical protein ABT099_19970 [Streptomyces prasinus]|uniref:hypothetical protein n=1 Tax=Streptomyces prasinus TaxID=67345 RepID=UPI00331CCAF6
MPIPQPTVVPAPAGRSVPASPDPAGSERALARVTRRAARVRLTGAGPAAADRAGEAGETGRRGVRAAPEHRPPGEPRPLAGPLPRTVDDLVVRAGAGIEP